MKDENKNQDEVKFLEFYFDKDNESAGIPFPIWKDEHAGDRETLKEICNILRRGAELLSGYEVAEGFCNFVKNTATYRKSMATYGMKRTCRLLPLIG